MYWFIPCACVALHWERLTCESKQGGRKKKHLNLAGGVLFEFSTLVPIPFGRSRPSPLPISRPWNHRVHESHSRIPGEGGGKSAKKRRATRSSGGGGGCAHKQLSQDNFTFYCCSAQGCAVDCRSLTATSEYMPLRGHLKRDLTRL